MKCNILELRVNADTVGPGWSAHCGGKAREDVSMRLLDVRLEFKHVGHDLAGSWWANDGGVAEVVIAQENVRVAVETGGEFRVVCNSFATARCIVHVIVIGERIGAGAGVAGSVATTATLVRLESRFNDLERTC